jgi:hypothetical protein
LQLAPEVCALTYLAAERQMIWFSLIVSQAVNYSILVINIDFFPNWNINFELTVINFFSSHKRDFRF